MSEALATSSEVGSRIGLTGPYTERQLSVGPIRFCITCIEPIPTARLKAQPLANQCVSCLQAAGDVALIKRFDEHSGSSTIETYYRGENLPIERAVRRIGQNVPSAKFLTDNTEAPIFKQKVNASGEQTLSEIISGVEELDIKEADTCAS